MSWYATGKNAKRESPSSARKVWRFRLRPKEEDANIVFLDSWTKPRKVKVKAEDGSEVEVELLAPFVFREHQLKIGERWEQFTCIEYVDESGEIQRPLGRPCPFCEAGLRASEKIALTVLDNRVWKDRNGNEHRGEVKLFVLSKNQPTYDKLVKESTRKDRKGMRGASYMVSRYGDRQSCNVGTDYEFQGVIPESKLVYPPTAPEELRGKPLEPLNYLEVLKPVPPEVAARVIGSNVEQSKPVEKLKDDEPLPF